MKDGYQPLDEREEPRRKSKTQKKKEMIALQKLGERLVDVKTDQLKKVPMPEDLREALLMARQMKSHEARRRQLQYVGTLMREVDPEPIERALEALSHGHGTDTRFFHRVEEWRDRLIEGDDPVMDELKSDLPGLDLQELHRLTVNARREASTGKPKGAKRALFRFLMAGMNEGQLGEDL